MSCCVDNVNGSPSSLLSGDDFSAFNSADSANFDQPGIVLPVDTERFVSSGNYALAAGVVTIRDAGRYLILADASFQGVTAVNQTIFARLQVNGADELGTGGFSFINLAFGNTCSMNMIRDFSAGDTVAIFADAPQGGAALAFATAERTRLSIIRRS